MRATARSELQDVGLAGVKLHPRLNGYDLLDPGPRAFLEELASWKVAPVVWLCTFLHHSGRPMSKGVVETLHEVAVTYPRLRFVFAHAAGADCLRLATAIRSCRNVVLDLSYTLVKFAGSSVDADLRHLLETFDRRLVFGSDFPEVRVTDAVGQLKRHLAAVKPEAADRVSSANLLEFLSPTHATARS
jgi:predicted TIM-barrel fold metal-dependent hydrolase